MNIDYAERAAYNIDNLFDSEIRALQTSTDFRKRVLNSYRNIYGSNSEKESHLQWILELEKNNLPNNKNGAIRHIFQATEIEVQSSENIVRVIDKDLIKIIGLDNSQLFKLNPFDFEQLIMDIFIKIHGCEDVIKTKQTRDGGVDIIGFFRDPFGEKNKIIVGCKCHKKDKLVSLESIRALSTVQLIQKAPLALYATTGRFSRNIDKFIENVLPIGGMKVADSNKILRWIGKKDSF